jgi:hypothetical protein
MQTAAAQTAFLLQQHEPWIRGLEDRHLADQPAPGGKTAGWLLGHLVVTGDFARRLCGLPPLAPREWRPLFGPGTTPSADPGSYPPMRDLVETFCAVYGDLAMNAATVSPAALAVPNPYEPARAAFPTAGDFARYLLTGHLGYHQGQLSLWRGGD